MFDAPIETLRVDTYRIPTERPEQDGTLRWDATEMVVVRIGAGAREGLGYSYTSARPAAMLIEDKLAPIVQGSSPFNTGAIWARMNDSVRNLGRPGLAMMAIAAVDQALWDLKARLLQLPLPRLWGQLRDSVPVYGSGGFINQTDPELIEQVRGWVELELSAIKIKIGNHRRESLRRAELVRDHAANATLMVDLNGACGPRDALGMAGELAELGVAWMEEPVSSDDLGGMAWLRDRVPGDLALAAGEYGWGVDYFERMLRSSAVDVLQADATRCGYTGFLQAATLCEAANVPISAHCAPAVHAPICTAVPQLLHLEHFHDHVRLESMLFDSGTVLRRGELWPDPQQPGHGLAFRDADAERFRL
ncbi:L-alanine-DL-glutamate epimerase [Halopseudomonas xinjiangensis]|uniref:L-alanine-DL-glutamate epimerase n=1 Tax=Halopseudomonas xinjiangensis TaxID=487184 RepID=A0A1H1SL99_9GAMM|nr:enolase C-terminal domain-like protein [Halopseudomonas xinjiangensis]SDS48722.1 L-alanine-DL-glutamate epimerase [Halopseudomonas xinjiangensis]